MYNYKTNGPLSHNSLGSQCTELTSDGGWIAAVQLSNNQRPNPFFFFKYDSTCCDSTTLYCQSVITGITHAPAGLVGEIGVAPNPATDRVTVSVGENAPLPGCLVLREVSGREILRTTVESPEIEIVLDQFESGLYFLCFESGGETYCKNKLIVAK